MIRKAIKYFVICLLFAAPVSAFSQDKAKEEADREKQFRDNIEQIVLKYEELLHLESWQTFYLDSILTHDYTAMSEELKALGKSKVENPDIYQTVRDNWFEQMYSAIHKVLNDEQWAKYLKNGAGKEKKARDKRLEKSKKQ